MRWLGREPAQWIQLASGLVIFLTPILHLTPEMQGAVMAVVTCAFGLATAAVVSSEKAAAAVAALIKALIALALAFRLNLTPDMQTGIMVLVEAATAWYLRTQVVAPEPARLVTRRAP